MFNVLLPGLEFDPLIKEKFQFNKPKISSLLPNNRKLKLNQLKVGRIFQVSIQDLTGQEIKLLLSVVRAYDVPIRSDPDPLSSHDGPKEALVHSYIEARFQVKPL